MIHQRFRTGQPYATLSANIPPLSVEFSISSLAILIGTYCTRDEGYAMFPLCTYMKSLRSLYESMLYVISYIHALKTRQGVCYSTQNALGQVDWARKMDFRRGFAYIYNVNAVFMEFGVTSVNVSIFWAGLTAGISAAAPTNYIITQLMLLCSHIWDIWIIITS